MNPHMTPAEISGFLERTLLRVQSRRATPAASGTRSSRTGTRRRSGSPWPFPTSTTWGSATWGWPSSTTRSTSGRTCWPSGSTRPGPTWKPSCARRAPVQPGDPPRPGRLRHRRLQPALRAALHQRAQHAGPGRPAPPHAGRAQPSTPSSWPAAAAATTRSPCQPSSTPWSSARGRR